MNFLDIFRKKGKDTVAANSSAGFVPHTADSDTNAPSSGGSDSGTATTTDTGASSFGGDGGGASGGDGGGI